MKKKDIVVAIGSGPASLMALIALYDECEIYLIEKPAKNFILGKRILVSGNGRCNFFNEKLTLTREGREVLSYLSLLHFAYKKEGDLYYPFFNRSECLHSLLEKNITTNKNAHVIQALALNVNPDKNTVTILENGNKRDLKYDYLIFAPGGRSYDRHDFSYDLINSLNVQYKPFESCLCPIKVREKIPEYLNKNRLKCNITLFDSRRVLYEEKNAEVLFKSDGLSGIGIFNCSLYIRQYEHQSKAFNISLDYSTKDDGTRMKANTIVSAPSFLRQYIKAKGITYPESLLFTFKDFYPFEESQISYGGILLSERDPNTLALKKYPNIFPIGEVMDNNFPCGGFNMGNALIEGLKVGKELMYK